MHRDVGMIEQERLDSRCFVATDVVADHVNLLRGAVGRYDLSEKGDELGTGVAQCSLAQHFAGGRVQRSEQTQGAIALVFEAMTLGTPGRKRRYPVLAVQR